MSCSGGRDKNLAGEIRRKVDGDFKHWLVENGVLPDCRHPNPGRGRKS